MSHSHSHDGDDHGHSHDGEHSHSHGSAKPKTTSTGAALEKEFKEAAERIRQEMSKPEVAALYTTEDKTRVYSLYKQATAGDVVGDQPWAFQFEARAKWDGWASLKGLGKEKAMQLYVDFANEKLH